MLEQIIPHNPEENEIINNGQAVVEEDSEADLCKRIAYLFILYNLGVLMGAFTHYSTPEEKALESKTAFAGSIVVAPPVGLALTVLENLKLRTNDNLICPHITTALQIFTVAMGMFFIPQAAITFIDEVDGLFPIVSDGLSGGIAVGLTYFGLRRFALDPLRNLCTRAHSFFSNQDSIVSSERGLPLRPPQ